MLVTVNKNDLVALGFSEGTSKRIIRQGKELLIERGFRIYKNKRIGSIPAKIATELLRFEVTSGIRYDN